jgi:hypothetical protein
VFLTAIIHNHPIHYKHLLFSELAKNGLDFEVLFMAASSGQRIERPLPRNGEYRYRFGWDGPYEDAPAIFIRRALCGDLCRSCGRCQRSSLFRTAN